MLRGRDSAASAARSPKRPLSRSASAALSAAVRADRSAPGSFFSMSIVPSRTALRSSSSSQRALSSSSSEGASRGSGARAAMSESVMRESAPSSRSRRRQPETAAAVTPASAARSAARSPASSRATSSIFLSKGKCTAFLRGGGATPAAFAQFTTAVRLQPASSAASVRLNPAATASTASSLVSNGYMRTPIRTPECPTFCPHPRNSLNRTFLRTTVVFLCKRAGSRTIPRTETRKSPLRTAGFRLQHCAAPTNDARLQT